MRREEQNPLVMIIAGETSGDHHGARLVQAMREKDPNILFSGIGGNRMREAGVEILVDAGKLSVVGITEVFSKLPVVLREAGRIKQEIARCKPELLILIDFPDFNLHMAKFAKKHDVPVLYYISPQIWAWRRGRIKTIRQYVDHMAVILPFEADFYRSYQVDATFVGHPLLDHYETESVANQFDADSDKVTVGLLPGSRTSEIERNLPVMLAAASQLSHRMEGIRFLVSMAPAIDAQWIETYIQPYRSVLDIELMPGAISEVLEQCTLVIAASGTVTLETAIHGVPMVIMYRISPVSYMLGRMLVHVDHIGLANIIAGERVVPELIQEDASPGKIAQTVSHLLSDKQALGELRKKLRSVREKLGGVGASAKTADIALSMIRQRTAKTDLTVSR